MITRLSLKSRLQLLTVVSALALLAIALFSLRQLHNTMMEDRRAGLRQVVEVAFGTLRHFHRMQSVGELSEDEARTLAAEAVRGMRYNGTEYLWINDRSIPTPRMIMHPTVRELEGRVMDDSAYNSAVSALAGMSGEARALQRQNLFVAFNEVIAQSGHGFVLYEWPKPLAEGGVSNQLYTK